LQGKRSRQHLIWLCSIPIFAIFLSILAACNNPISGLNLVWSDNYAITTLPDTSPLGTKIVAINSREGKLALTASDFARNPNREFASYDSYWQFLRRQQQLYLTLQAEHVQFITAAGDTISVATQKSRHFSELPLHFWQKLATGLMAWILGASLFYFDSNTVGRRYLFLSCGALFSASLTSSVYSSRELAMSGPLLVVLCDLKFLADLLLSASLVGILRHFPKRIGHYSIDIALFCLAIAWFVVSEAGILNTSMNRQFAIPIGILTAVAMAVWQWHVHAKAPVHNAALFCFFTFMSPALLFTLNAISNYPSKLHGLLSIDYTTPLLWILCGLALGISRYKLNSLTRHRYLFFILVSAIGFCVIAISHYLSLAQWPVYAPPTLLLLLLGFGLAIHQTSKSLAAPPVTSADLLQLAAINYHARDEDIDQAWQTFISQFFDSVTIKRLTANYPSASISHAGKFLDVPLLKGIGSLRCEYADGNKRLFHASDAQIIDTLCATAKGLITANQQFHRQQQVQNKQFANDLQHNIGEALLPALRHDECDPIKEVIRNILAESHTISSGLYGRKIALHELLADLHLELEQRLDRLGVILDWTVQLPTTPINLAYPAYKTLSSSLRELVRLSSQAADVCHACIDITYEAQHLVITFRAHNKGVYLALNNIAQSDSLPRIIAALHGEMRVADNQKIQLCFLASALHSCTTAEFINRPLGKNPAS